jgi:hypothetical protein
VKRNSTLIIHRATSLRRGLFSLSLALVTLLIAFTMAPARAGEKLSFDRLELKTGLSILKADAIEIENANLSADALKALFTEQAPAQQADALAKFDADRITIKSLRQETSINGQVSASILRNVVLTGIKSGVAESLKADGGTFGSGDGNEAQAGTMGAITATTIDLGVLIAGGATKSGKRDDFRTAYGEVILTSIATDAPQGPAVSIDRISIRDFRIKTSEQGISAVAERIIRRQSTTGAPPSTDADINAMALDMVDLFAGFAIGTSDASQIKIEDKKTGEYARINHILYEGDLSGKGQHIRMDGFEGAFEGSRVRIGSVEQSGYSFGPVYDSIRSTASKPNTKLSEADPLSFVPIIGKFEIRDVTIDTTDVPPVHAGLRSMVLSVDNPTGGIPKSVDLAFDGLFGPIPSDSNEPTIDNFIALGYRDVSLSGTLRLAIDEKAKMFKTEALISGENMGAVGVTANLINVPVDLLMRNPSAALIAFAGARVKDLSLTVENRGLVDRLVDQDAIKTKRSPQEVRKNYAAVASASLQIYLGMSPNAKTLTQAIAKFIDKPARLSITAKAKNPDGVALAEGATAESPAQLLEAFDLMISQN